MSSDFKKSTTKATSSPKKQPKRKETLTILTIPEVKTALRKIKTAFNETNLNEGHRSRLRSKILVSGCEFLAEYELIEALLTFAIPRKDTKALAKILLSSFKGISGLISAEASELLRIKGVGETIATIIKLIHGIVLRALKEDIKATRSLDNIESVIEYCKMSIGHLSKEVHMVLFLDVKNSLIDTELKTFGTIDEVHTYPREIISKALELRAKSIIMTHNHPSGDVTPSIEDIETTKHVQSLAQMMHINLYDHVIVSFNEVYSMKMNGDI